MLCNHLVKWNAKFLVSFYLCEVLCEMKKACKPLTEAFLTKNTLMMMKMRDTDDKYYNKYSKKSDVLFHWLLINSLYYSVGIKREGANHKDAVCRSLDPYLVFTSLRWHALSKFSQTSLLSVFLGMIPG